MRIIVNGQQAFGKGVLDALIERGDEVVGVYCAPEKEGQRPDPIKEAAEAHKQGSPAARKAEKSSKNDQSEKADDADKGEAKKEEQAPA